MKIYKAKSNMPGCHKDRLINFDGKQYTYADNGSPCMYDCENEPKFFVLHVETQFKPGVTVILSISATYKICTMNGTASHKSFKLPAFTEMRIMHSMVDNKNHKLVLKWNATYYLVPAKDVKIPEQYFYVSSKGIIHPTWIGRDANADKFRKSVGNVHATKASAEIYKRIMREFVKDALDVSK